jgi:Ca2+-binding RTX toxin-like protein
MVFALADYVAPYNIEALFLAGTATRAVANDHGSVLVGNAACDSTLVGGEGDDLLVGTHSSITSMIGGSGDDTFVVFSEPDVISEQPGGGWDTVVTYRDYALPADVENLILHPSAGNINGTGGSTDNTIVGNGGANVIDGGGGADILVGGGGGDTFVFHRGEANGDLITDFDANNAEDHLVFIGYGSAAEGATLTQIDDTHWSINSADGLAHDVIAFNNAAIVHAHGFMFA